MSGNEQVTVRIQGDVRISICQEVKMSREDFEELDALSSSDLADQIIHGLACIELDIDNGSIDGFDLDAFDEVKNV